MKFSSRFVVYALGATAFAGWLLADGLPHTDLPAALKDIQESVRHLSQEVKALQSAVKELAAATKHAVPAAGPAPVLARNSKSGMERASEAYDRASGSEKLKLYQPAVEAYTESIVLDPKNDAAFLHRGLCYVQLNELENALADLNQSLLLQPNNSRGYEARAAVESKVGQLDKALADLNQALERDPAYADAHLLRGELLLQRGDARNAIVEFSNAMTPPVSERAHLERSEAYRSTGQLDLALADCNDAVLLNPAAPTGFLCRAQIYLKQGHADSALADLNRAVSREDPSPVKTMVGSASRILREQQSAHQTADRGPAPLQPAPPPVKAAPETPKQTVPAVAVVAMPVIPREPPGTTSLPPAPRPTAANSDQRRAEQIVNKGLAAPAPAPRLKEDARERARRGRESMESGDWQQALDSLTRAIALDPKLASAYNARGYVYLRLRQSQQALADFTEAIRLEPDYLNAYHNRAVARKLLGDSAGALADNQSYDRIARSRRPVEAATAPLTQHP